ncbi:leucine-rich repeats and immunoglobulin-like domains protein 3 [Acipenser ruthenus]|uniref:leucine-rich repeats and immunoglobulin-like domains protein 3 n=1 Tax=Acipenser ruthenus TaxID=7906 RepID=UPI00274278CB|nr:leucine-rich repeats and immunoglobulin-like domains protein 3 [Acipenser ruthenus]
MSAPRQWLNAARLSIMLVLFSGLELTLGIYEKSRSSPSPCSCIGDVLDCSRRRLDKVPANLPTWIVQLDLSNNKLKSVEANAFQKLHSLRELKLNNNELDSIPDLGPLSANITLLSVSNNKIGELIPEQLNRFQSLETLDLSNNNIVEVKATSFTQLQLKYLYINSNKIASLEPGCFDSLSSSLQILKLNRNRISSIPPKIFKLSQLQQLELNRNRIKKVDGLSFHGLSSLKSLKIQRNGISKLMDGAFWGLSSMEVLQLDYNNLTEVSKGWLYGLLMLQQLHLSQNAISRIEPDAWEFCQKLSELDLTSNQLTRLDESSFVGLSLLGELHIGNNKVSFIADGAFRGLSSLYTLDLKNNEISWTIEDMNGAFSALDKLRKLVLQGNRIRSITKKAFSGLDVLEHLDLNNNAIMSIQGNAFSQMKKLQELHLNTSSLLCDCQLKWFLQWVADNQFQPFINASCAHPQLLKGKSIFVVNQEDFVCDDFPKPQITVQPETQSAIKGYNVSFVCSAASSSDSPMTFAWKKDNEALNDAEIENYAHLRAQGGEVMEYTTILRLRDVDFSSEGKYQCVISNHFGSSYSTKAKLTVNMLPSFTKMPMDLTIRAGAMARLECAAVGHPTPQIAWQKDGGTDFPAARERRMHVMPEDDVFFIVDVKTEDIGVYSCTAQNSAGTISANATLTVLETPSFMRPLMDRTVAKGETAVLQCIAGGSPPPKLNWTKDDSPLVVTERHFFAAGNQLLIIVDTNVEDAGKYTCEMSNTLGTERGNIQLNVVPSPNCDSTQTVGQTLEEDGWTTVGIVIIAVVCCVVGTSLVWVVIIYHTRRRNEDCSVTNTDETNLPADIPSYLSSQGTLADRQDGYIPSENGSHHQFMASSITGYYLQQRDLNGMCLDTGSEMDMEAVMDPLLCHYQGTIGSMCTRGNMYGTEPSDGACFNGCTPDQRPVCIEPYEGNIKYCKSKAYYPCTHPLENPFDPAAASMLMQLPNGCLHSSVHTQNEGSSADGDIPDFNRNRERMPTNTFMGTFGKSLWRPQQEFYSGYSPSAPYNPMTLHENPHATVDTDSEPEEENVLDCADSTNGQSMDIYEQPFDNHRTDTFKPYRIST